MHRIQRALCATALATFAALPAFNTVTVRADVAPPAQAPGSNPEPGAATKVQMFSERVVLQVLRVKGKGNDDLPLAEVAASFIMRNNGDKDETMVVRFPINDPSGNGDGFGGQPEIRNIVIKVNGKAVRTSIVTTANPNGPKQPDIKWAAFDTTFLSGKDTFIEVSYALDSTGYQPYGTFKYILETGAGWDGPIGDAQIMLDLPYDATDENVVLEESTPNGVIKDGNVAWEFKDIEPKADDNFHVTVLAPGTWAKIVDARAETKSKPNDAQAWRNLAKAYRAAIFVKYGPQTGAKFVPLIEQAYAHAIDLDKASAQLPAELAETLIDIYPAITGGLDKDVAPQIFDALRESFKRDPKNATSLRLLKDLRKVLAQMASGSGADAEAAKAQLDALNKIAVDAGVDQPAPVATTKPAATATAPVMPTAQVTPTVEAGKEITSSTAMTTPTTTGDSGNVQTSTTTVTSTTDSGVVFTATTMTTATQTMTDAATSRPVVVVTTTESAMITATSDVTGSVPATVTEVAHTSVVTSMMPMPATTPLTPSAESAAPPFSQVITASTTATKTEVVTDAKTGVMTPSAIVTSTDIATKTVQADPIDATKPATTTVTDVSSVTSAPVVTDTTQPIVTNTQTVTATTTLPEAGSTAPAVTSTITETAVATATTKAGDATTPPTVEVVTQTTVESATVDSTGVITAAPPVVNVVTSTLPVATSAAGSTSAGSTTTSTTATSEGTLTGTVTGAMTPTVAATSDANVVPTDAPVDATAVVSATDVSGATAPATPRGLAGLQPIGWLAWLATYVIGAAVVYGIASRRRQD